MLTQIKVAFTFFYALPSSHLFMKSKVLLAPFASPSEPKVGSSVAEPLIVIIVLRRILSDFFLRVLELYQGMVVDKPDFNRAIKTDGLPEILLYLFFWL
jgi:hypothetical protein